MKNKDMNKFYDSIAGKNDHYTFKGDEEADMIMSMLSQVKDKRVLDLGCGTGGLTFAIGKMGAKLVLGIDYSTASICMAEASRVKNRVENVFFMDGDITGSLSDYTKILYDIIVSQGVLEHLDHPFGTLHKWMDGALVPGGYAVISVPCWDNPRGIVLMTIQHLLGVPVTIADQHFLTTEDFVDFAEIFPQYRLTAMKTCHASHTSGPKMVEDISKRLHSEIFRSRFRKVMDKELDMHRVDDFIEWLGKLSKRSDHFGCIAGYRIDKE